MAGIAGAVAAWPLSARGRQEPEKVAGRPRGPGADQVEIVCGSAQQIGQLATTEACAGVRRLCSVVGGAALTC